VLQVSFSVPMLAHEGHDHDKPAPLNLPVAPRLVAVTPDYELVAVLSGEQRLTIFLHRFATNEPIKDAKLTVAMGEHEAEATKKEDGAHGRGLQAGTARRPGHPHRAPGEDRC
jgi:hypothetical protein